MKYLIIVPVFMLLLSSSAAHACSFAGVEMFKPTLERWERHPGPAQSSGEGDYWEKVPSPVVHVSEVTRGTDKPGASCDDAGTLVLEVSLPEESTYSIEEFGVYFRVLEGQLPDAIFPDIPLVGEYKDEKVTLLLAWLDGHPSQQIPLELTVEAFLVTNGLDIGKSTTFSIKAETGK